MMILLILLLLASCENVYDIDYDDAESGIYKGVLNEGEEMYEGECLFNLVSSPKAASLLYSFMCVVRIETTFYDEELDEIITQDALHLTVRKKAFGGPPEGSVMAKMAEEMKATKEFNPDEMNPDMAEDMVSGPTGNVKYDKVLYFLTEEEADVEFKIGVERCNVVVKNAVTGELMDTVTDILIGWELYEEIIPDDYNGCYITVCTFGSSFYYEGYKNKMCMEFDEELDMPYTSCTAEAEYYSDDCLLNVDTILMESDF